MSVPQANITLEFSITTPEDFVQETFAESEFYRTSAGGHVYTSRDIPTGIRGHLGYDLHDYVGDPRLWAGVGGRVHHRYDSTLGNMCSVEHSSGLWLTFCHCSRYLTADGALVDASTPIAVIGDSGSGASSPHLHFTVLDGGRYGYFRDPTAMLNQGKVMMMSLLQDVQKILAILENPDYGLPKQRSMQVGNAEKIQAVKSDTGAIRAKVGA